MEILTLNIEKLPLKEIKKHVVGKIILLKLFILILHQTI